MLLPMVPTREASQVRSRQRRLVPALAMGLATGLLSGIPFGTGAIAQPLPQSGGSVAAEQAIRASYRCLGRFDAVEATALFFNREPAELVLLVGETATRLPRVLAASGVRYGAADQVFWIKGDRASWSLGKAPAMACQVIYKSKGGLQ